MRILISAVGTRGDVQPAIALAVEAQALGCDVTMCLPPNFVGWANNLGFEAHPMGVAMRLLAPGAPLPQMPDLIADQFSVVEAAAEGCDIILASGAHQYAARSVAERRGAAYVSAVYAPVSLPSAELAPDGGLSDADAAWEAYRERWNARTLDRVNARRAALRLPPIADGLAHILGHEPWLAADTLLGPAPVTPELQVVQTGAWMLADVEPLPADLEAFLKAGEPPVYLGFGSMPAGGITAGDLIEAVRAVGRRAVLSAGWAGLAPVDDAPDVIGVSDVNHQALFPRVAAVVHHGGAGTTTTAARAGAPQVIVPMFSDQFYWARRVRELGIGASLPAATLTPGILTQALERALDSVVRAEAAHAKDQVCSTGAAAAARLVLAMCR